MHIIRSVRDMQVEALRLKRAGRRVGFVPTMGYLHPGHLSLVHLARERADTVVLSLFVNPAQFGPHEDLTRYPRNFDRDEGLCREAGVDLLFYPAAAEVYAGDASVVVDEGRLTRAYEGAERSGHFRGVLTVVAKLFNLVLPDMAVFGQKDAQQLAAVRRMVRDLNFPVELVAGPTVREPDGLAMSSRNVYLDPEQRVQARSLRRALDRAEARVRAGERNAQAVKDAMSAVLAEASGARPDYVDIVGEEDFEPVAEVTGPCRAILAVRFGATRLLDNTGLVPPAPSPPGA